MKSKSKLLFSIITAAAVFTGGLAVQHSSNVSAALKPLTYLELNDGDVTGTTVDVRGWALNSNGVSAADLYVDGKYIKTMDVNEARPDVDKSFPGYKNGSNSGFDYSLQLTPGKHVIKVYAIGNDKAVVYKQATITVQGSDSKMNLELSNNQVFEGSVDIRGWSLNNSGTRAVDVYIDGNFVRTITPDEFKARPDVTKIFPGYKDGANCGFDYKKILLAGYHKIRVYSIGNDNNVMYKDAVVDCKSDLPNRLNLELEENQNVGTRVDIRGWQLSLNRIYSVDLYVDGNYEKTFFVGQGGDFQARPDVLKVFPQYEETDKYGSTNNGDTCGFDWPKYLPAGRHNIKVYALGLYKDVLLSKEVNVNVVSQ